MLLSFLSVLSSLLCLLLMNYVSSSCSEDKSPNASRGDLFCLFLKPQHTIISSHTSRLIPKHSIIPLNNLKMWIFSHMRSFLREQFIILSVEVIFWFFLHEPLLLVQKVMWYSHPFHCSCAWLPCSHHYIFNSRCLIRPINPCKFIVGLIGKCLKFISINNRLEWASLEVKFLQTD